jgi:quinol monooxygenase YgiN
MSAHSHDSDADNLILVEVWANITAARRHIAERVPKGVSLAENLIRDRRAEGAHGD